MDRRSANAAAQSDSRRTHVVRCLGAAVVTLGLILLTLLVSDAVAGERTAPLLSGICTDVAGRTIPDVFVQLWRIPSGVSAPSGFAGLELAAQTRIHRHPELQLVATVTTDMKGLWSTRAQPRGRYLINAQALRDGGRQRLSVQRTIELSQSRAQQNVPLTLEAEQGFAGALARPSDPQTIYFATDRKPLPERGAASSSVAGTLSFDNERGNGLHFGMCDVDGSDNHQLSHCLRQSRANVFAALQHAIGASPKRQGLVYVHGFNVSFPDAMRTGAVLAASTLRPTFVYDWTSYKNLAAYPADEENLTWSLNGGGLALLGALFTQKSTNMVFFAHSMGTRTLAQIVSFIHAANDLGMTLRPHIQRIVLAAGDLDVSTFKGAASTLTQMGSVTNSYASRNDLALEISKNIHPNHDRIGESGQFLALMKGVISVDATAADPRTLIDPVAHGYFQQRAFLADIAEFYDGTDPSKRERLDPAIDKSFWWFKKPDGPIVVAMEGDRFTPNLLRVAAGTTVVFHNISVAVPMKLPDRQLWINPGEEFRYRFTKPGTYNVSGTSSNAGLTIIVVP